MYKRDQDGLRVLLVHPGGPFWAKKDLGAWSIPKGEYGPDEDPLTVAKREFAEELGAEPAGAFRPLGEVVQPGRKVITAWALKGEFDLRQMKSNLFEIEWPPKSGKRQSFPEVDRAAWLTPSEARHKILVGQRDFIDRLEAFAQGSG